LNPSGKLNYRESHVLDVMKFRFYYAGVRVRDLGKSVKFYTGAMGMKVVHKGTMPHGGKFVQLRGKESKQTLELNWYPPDSRFYSEYAPGDEMDHLAFIVKDVPKAYKELISKGATPAVSPKESKGTEVYVKDPDGIWIELLS
jgi:lactoylglutathione lyase